MEKVYKFNLSKPFSFFKAGHYIADAGWQHKDIVNDYDYELFLMLNGAAYIKIGQTKYTLHRHDCLLIPPRIRHVGFKKSPNNTIYYWLHFFPQESISFEYLPERIHADEIIIPRFCHLHNFTRITLLMRQLLDSANSAEALPLNSDYFVSSIAAEVSTQYIHECRKQRSAKDTSRYELIKNWIRIHAKENLTVTKVANNFNISPTYLAHLFQTHDQLTTVRYINHVRIQQAQELLLTTDMAVKQIALELHFDNEKYFYRVFKQVTGTTASHYRNAFNKTYLNNIKVDPKIPKPSHKDVRI